MSEGEDKYNFVCLVCNKTIGTSKTEHESPPTTCNLCGGTRVATQPIMKEEFSAMDFDVVVYNKKTGVSKHAGFTLRPEEYRKRETIELTTTLATKIAECYQQILNPGAVTELVKGGEVKGR